MSNVFASVYVTNGAIGGNRTLFLIITNDSFTHMNFDSKALYHGDIEGLVTLATRGEINQSLL
jgi:hypothetical protein